MKVPSYERIFVGGHWQEPTGGGRIDVVSPHSEALVKRAIVDRKHMQLGKAPAQRRQQALRRGHFFGWQITLDADAFVALAVSNGSRRPAPWSSPSGAGPPAR